MPLQILQSQISDESTQVTAVDSSSSDHISIALENLHLNSSTQQTPASNNHYGIPLNGFQNATHESQPSYSIWSGDYLGNRQELLQNLNLCSTNYGRTYMLPHHVNYINGGFVSDQGINFNGEPIVQYGNCDWVHHQNLHYDDHQYALDFQRLFESVLSHLFELMIDPDRHKILKEFMDLCNETQLQLIVTRIISQPESFVEASRNSSGLNFIKKLLGLIQKCSSMDNMLSLISLVFFHLMIDKTSQHVILDCLRLLDAQKKKVLYQAAIDNAMNLASHEQGYVSLNNFITLLRRPYRDEMLNLISSNAVWLAQDPWGNFVLQHVLALHNPFYNNKICSQLKGNYERISIQEAGSYVVQKCVETSIGMSYAVEELLQSSKLLQIAKDKYGNYVIQSALEATKRANSPLHQQLVDKLRQHRDVLKCTHFGKHVFNKINNVSLQC